MPDLSPQERVYTWVEDRTVAGAVCSLLEDAGYPSKSGKMTSGRFRQIVLMPNEKRISGNDTEKPGTKLSLEEFLSLVLNGTGTGVSVNGTPVAFGCDRVEIGNNLTVTHDELRAIYGRAFSN